MVGLQIIPLDDLAQQVSHLQRESEISKIYYSRILDQLGINPQPAVSKRQNQEVEISNMADYQQDTDATLSTKVSPRKLDSEDANDKSASSKNLNSEDVNDKSASPKKSDSEDVNDKSASPKKLDSEVVNDKSASPKKFDREDVNDKNASPKKFESEDINDKSAPTSKTRRKAWRSSSKYLLNKSFDNNILLQSTKPAQPRMPRRQKSVTDFLQNMLSKSKLHLQDIFALKKDKMRQTSQTGEVEKQSHPLSPEINPRKANPIGAEGGEGHNHLSLNPKRKYSLLHRSCPSIYTKADDSMRPASLKPHGSLNARGKVRLEERRQYTGVIKLTSPRISSETLNMFMVSSSGNSVSANEGINPEQLYNHRPIVKTLNRQQTISNTDTLHAKFKSSMSSSVSPDRRKSLQSSPISCKKHVPPRIITPENLDPTDDFNGDMTRKGRVSSAPPDREYINSSFECLITEDGVSKMKRALVKSNSDTLSKLNSSPQTLVKASSDGNCFIKSSASALASSMISLGSVMIGVTDYLFLGSVEAAYNEPLLCKYGISSLIDMTNVNPSLVPANKKSDCPCACSKKTHFRSKLNIGVDDIEWENLEPYFDDINAFIHGARKKGRRVLVFSYLGQSRAATAVIQHIMQHFKISYQKAMDIVRAKRPEIKLNSGFVKALLRLEQRLELGENSRKLEFIENESNDESYAVLRSSDEVLDALSVPPVVRGAWLESYY